MVTRYDAILAAIPVSLLGAVASNALFAGAVGTISFVLGVVAALALVGRALSDAPGRA